MKDLFKKAKPHLLAIVVFSIIVTVLYYPLLFEGKTIHQDDILHAIGSSAEISKFRGKNKEEPLWTNSMFGGMPAYLISTRWAGKVYYIPKVIGFLFPWGSSQATFICFLSFYILLLCFGINPYLAIAGGIVYGLNSFTLVSIEAGHMWKVYAIAYAPMVLGGIHLCFSRKNIWLGAALTCVGLSLQIDANHPQITYYLAIIILIYGIDQLFKHIKAKKVKLLIKPAALVLIASSIAVTCNLSRLWCTYEYGKFSNRGGSELTSDPNKNQRGLDHDYVFNWSSGIMETFTLLIPSFKGGASAQQIGVDSNFGKVLQSSTMTLHEVKKHTNRAPIYWGNQPHTSGPVYAGAIIIFMFILALYYVERKYMIWLVVTSVLSIMLSWGKNFAIFNDLVFEIVPFYSKFRTVPMSIFIAMVTIPLLGFLGLDKLLKQKNKNNKDQINKLTKASLITGGVVLFFALFGTFLFSFSGVADEQLPKWFLKGIIADRKAFFTRDAWASLFFIMAAAGSIWLMLKGKISTKLLIGIITLLILIDLWVIDSRYLNKYAYRENSKANFLRPTEADLFIQKDTDIHYRVLNFDNSFNDARTSAHHKDVGGYHAVKIRRYQDLIEQYINVERIKLINALNSGKRSFKDCHVLNMLNTKYFIGGKNKELVFRNPFAFGNAWFVSRIAEVSSPDEEIENIKNINLHNEAVVDVSKFEVEKINYDPNARITLKKYEPNYLKYIYTSETPGFVVFSEIYYNKGWKAYLDGKPINHIRANYVLRGMHVPSGTHEIEFQFKPISYAIGNKISAIGSWGVILIFIVTISASLVSLILKK